MRDRYTTQELLAALGGIDDSTLRRWLDASGIMQERGKRDARQRYITAVDAQRIAALHDIVLRDLPDDLPTTLTSAWQRIILLVAEMRRLQAQVMELQELLEEAHYQDDASHVLPPSLPRERHRSASVSGTDTLPDGFEAIETYCRRINVSSTTVRYAIARGDLLAHRGQWKQGRATIRMAVDAEQQEAIVAWYASRKS